MSDPQPQPQPERKLWSRALPARTGPKRNSGGLYRTAENGEKALGGVPLNTANAAVVAAVRLAYRVAEAQVDRSTRLARRLREAGDKQAGPFSDSQALDATERLVMKTLMSGLEWWEGSVAEGRCPVKRLAAAEYQMLGTILGFAPVAHGKKEKAGTHKAAAAAPEAPPRDAKRSSPPSADAMPVVLKGEKKNRRRVVVGAWDIASASGLDTTVYFHCAEHAQEQPMEATLDVAGDGKIRLVIEPRPGAMAGRWVCAICDLAGLQVGFIEISL
jgi:hypothetical protein